MLLTKRTNYIYQCKCEVRTHNRIILALKITTTRTTRPHDSLTHLCITSTKYTLESVTFTFFDNFVLQGRLSECECFKMDMFLLLQKATVIGHITYMTHLFIFNHLDTLIHMTGKLKHENVLSHIRYT